MAAGSKRINPNMRGKIQTMKNNMRFSKSPFDGDGYPFKQAIKELRDEGISIVHDSVRCRYYNSNTVDPKWIQ